MYSAAKAVIMACVLVAQWSACAAQKISRLAYGSKTTASGAHIGLQKPAQIAQVSQNAN